MARIFSWKITNGKYAYLVKDEVNNTYIRNRVSDQATLLQFSKIVLGFSENQYMLEYNNLRSEVLSLYGRDLGNDYTVYYDTGEDDGPNKLILLSGRDGENGSDARSNSEVISEKTLKVLNSAIDNRISEFTEQENLLSDNIKRFVETSVGVNMSATMQSLNETNAQLAEMRTQVDNVRTKNSEIADSLETFTGGTIDGMTSLLSQTSEMKSWLNNYGGSLSGIVSDYNEARATIAGMAGGDPTQGVFKNIASGFTNVTTKISNVETKCTELSGTVENISKKEIVETEPVDMPEVMLGKSSPSEDNEGQIKLKTSFSDDGLEFTYGDENFISFINGEITLQSGDFGLKITNDGIMVRKNGGKYTKADI